MTPLQIAGVLLCVLAISIGQILFKRIGLDIQLGGGSLNLRILLLGGLALFFYGGATLLWIYLLRFVPLSRAYMFMSLSFVIVPLTSYFFFDEPLSLHTYLGVGLIVAGVAISTKLG